MQIAPELMVGLYKQLPPPCWYFVRLEFLQVFICAATSTEFIWAITPLCTENIVPCSYSLLPTLTLSRPSSMKITEACRLGV